MRWYLFFLYISLPLAAAFGQDTSLLRWQEKEPLNWSHFRGKPAPADKVQAAVTYAGIEVQVKRVDFLSGHIQFYSFAVFDPAHSWVQADRKDSLLLAHEQLHFDITEVYARKLANKLNSLELTKKDKARIREVQRQYRHAQLQAQERYDKESVHGLHSKYQQAWRGLIDEELKKPGQSLKLRPSIRTAIR